MEFFLELLKIIVAPLSTVVVIWFVVKGFLDRETDAVKGLLAREAENQRVKLAAKNKELLTPIRLQAYERMTLFASRLELGNILLRTPRPADVSAKALKVKLIQDIEEELKHNITQQIYMSNELWDILLLAKNEAIYMISNVFEQLDANASAKDLGDAIFAHIKEKPQGGYLKAQVAIKTEIATLF